MGSPFFPLEIVSSGINVLPSPPDKIPFPSPALHTPACRGKGLETRDGAFPVVAPFPYRTIGHVVACLVPCLLSVGVSPKCFSSRLLTEEFHLSSRVSPPQFFTCSQRAGLWISFKAPDFFFQSVHVLFLMPCFNTGHCYVHDFNLLEQVSGDAAYTSFKC